MNQRILIIDDDLELGDLLRDYLGMEGFAVDIATDGESGTQQVRHDSYGLIILDVMLPRLDGFEVLQQIRQHSCVPVIMLTARGDDIDRIIGLELGADDYLPKPFNPRELVARIRSIQRRVESVPAAAGDEPGTDCLLVDDLKLDRGRRSVSIAEREIELTSAEFSLLETLLSQAGQVVPRDSLTTQVLGRELTPYDRSVDVHISSLRKKLGPNPAGSERIRTIRGVGYQYAVTAVRRVA